MNTKTCPFCRVEKAGRRVFCEGSHFSGLYQVECSCGARGPRREGAYEAAAAWNVLSLAPSLRPKFISLGVCPYCCDKTALRETMATVPQHKHYVRCACGARGPDENTVDRAMTAWNEISRLRFSGRLEEERVEGFPPGNTKAAIEISVFNGVKWHSWSNDEAWRGAYQLLLSLEQNERVNAMEIFCRVCGSHMPCEHIPRGGRSA